MAEACDFEGTNFIFQAPSGMDNCIDLPVMMMKDRHVSCFKLTDEELEIVKETGVIWLSIHAPLMPPVALHAKLYEGGDPKPQPLNSTKLSTLKKE